MNHTIAIPIVLSLLTLELGAQVHTTQQRPARQDIQAARSFRQLKVPGEAVATGIAKLTDELRWHQTLGAALQTAKRSDKPVIWIQALGDIDGFL